MRFKLIVFDWDGTLMDSEARIVACIQAAFRDVGERPPSAERARNIIGLGLNEAMAVLWPEAEIADRQRVVDRYRLHFLGGDQTPSELFQGARETIEWLGERGYLLAVATGKSRRGLNESLATTELAHAFHTTRCADDAFSKPNPEMLLQIMDELGVKASDTLMVGDTEYDLEMARSAGTGALAVCYGVHEPERLLKLDPLDCLSSLHDIPRWLESRDAG